MKLLISTDECARRIEGVLDSGKTTVECSVVLYLKYMDSVSKRLDYYEDVMMPIYFKSCWVLIIAHFWPTGFVHYDYDHLAFMNPKTVYLKP